MNRLKSRMARRTAALFASLLLASLSLDRGAALAHDHESPVVSLRADARRQDGIPREVWWAERRAERECVAWNEVGPGDFPDVLEASSGRWLKVRFHTPYRPSDVAIREWRVVDLGAVMIAGPERTQEFELVPVKSHAGKTFAWDARFERPSLGRYHYEVFVQWRDREGCGIQQGGFWRFHLQVAP